MASTGLFTFFALALAVLLGLYGTPWRKRISYWLLLAASVLLTIVTGYFAWREHDSLRRLKALIDLPPYEESIYVPRGAEIRTVARLLPANIPPDFPLNRQESEQIRNGLLSANDVRTFWILKTSNPVASVRDFYQNRNHHRGWQIAEQRPTYLLFERANSTLAIFLLDDFPRHTTAMVYALSEIRSDGPAGE